MGDPKRRISHYECLSESEDKASAETKQFGSGDIAVSANCGTAGGLKGVESHFKHAKIYMATKSVIGPTKDSVLGPINADGAGGRTCGADTDRSLKIGLKGATEGLRLDPEPYHEAVEGSTIAVHDGVTDIHANFGFALLIKVIVASHIYAVEHPGGGISSKESEGSRIGLGVADSGGDRVKIEAKLSLGHNGRQR